MNVVVNVVSFLSFFVDVVSFFLSFLRVLWNVFLWVLFCGFCGMLEVL